MSRNRGWNLPLKPLECFCLHNLWNAFWLEWLDATNLVTYRSAKLHRGSVGNKSSVVPGSCWLSSEEFLQPNLYGMTLAYFNCATSLPTFAILLQLFMVYPCLPEFWPQLSPGISAVSSIEAKKPFKGEKDQSKKVTPCGTTFSARCLVWPPESGSNTYDCPTWIRRWTSLIIFNYT